MIDLSLKKKRQFYSDSLRSQRQVLFESKIKDSMLEGWTDNYIKVAVPYESSLVNQVVDAKLIDFDEKGRVLTEMLSNVS